MYVLLTAGNNIRKGIQEESFWVVAFNLDCTMLIYDNNKEKYIQYDLSKYRIYERNVVN